MTHSQLISCLEKNLPTALAHLERWVGINSFTANIAGVNELGVATAGAFSPLGFAPEFVPSRDPGVGSHLFLRRGMTDRPPLVLVTHLDTVFPPEEEVRNDFRWQPAPAEGRIYGPGTVDIKGGTALIWLVLSALAELAPEVLDAHQWLIAANASEETLSADFAAQTIERCQREGGTAVACGGPRSAPAACPASAKPTQAGDTQDRLEALSPLARQAQNLAPERSDGARAVLVFEGGLLKGREFTLVTGRKGKADYRLTATGRAAHAGSQHAEGRNAIVALAELVPRLAALTNYDDEVTVNVGTFHAGTVVNRVPHEARLELEMRAFRPERLRRAQDAVEALAGPSPTLPGAVMVVEKRGETLGWPGDAGTQSLFDLFAAVAADQCASAIPERRGGLSDANYLAVLGPTIDGLGPSGGCAHCSERSADGIKVPEFVETGSFIPKAALVVEALRRMG